MDKPKVLLKKKAPPPIFEGFRVKKGRPTSFKELIA
jgi:hypothetical protein